MADRHTPGPWRLQRSPHRQDGEYDFAIHADGVMVLAEAFGRDAHGGTPPAEANARLIAAAPTMLTELRKAEAFISGFEGDELQEGIDDLLSEIRAAIKQAEAI